jgi:hypothetical protein
VAIIPMLPPPDDVPEDGPPVYYLPTAVSVVSGTTSVSGFLPLNSTAQDLPPGWRGAQIDSKPLKRGCQRRRLQRLSAGSRPARPVSGSWATPVALRHPAPKRSQSRFPSNAVHADILDKCWTGLAEEKLSYCFDWRAGADDDEHYVYAIALSPTPLTVAS